MKYLKKLLHDIFFPIYYHCLSLCGRLKIIIMFCLPLSVFVSLSEHSLSQCYFSIPFSRSKAVFTAAWIHSYHNFDLNFNRKLRILWFRPRTFLCWPFVRHQAVGFTGAFFNSCMLYIILCHSLYLPLLSFLPTPCPSTSVCVRERESECVCMFFVKIFYAFFSSIIRFNDRLSCAIWSLLCDHYSISYGCY